MEGHTHDLRTIRTLLDQIEQEGRIMYTSRFGPPSVHLRRSHERFEKQLAQLRTVLNKIEETNPTLLRNQYTARLERALLKSFDHTGHIDTLLNALDKDSP